jgi:hypothetical protein
MADDRGTLDDIISRVEGRVGVTLTADAREMLARPIMERVERGQSIDWPTVESSIFKIVDAAKQDWRRPDEESNGQLNATAIIRGFSAQWCNIPPFCIQTGGGR